MKKTTKSTPKDLESNTQAKSTANQPTKVNDNEEEKDD